MEEFKKQAECLNLGLVEIQDPSTGAKTNSIINVYVVSSKV